VQLVDESAEQVGRDAVPRLVVGEAHAVAGFSGEEGDHHQHLDQNL
jgi:hypothetical protein